MFSLIATLLFTLYNIPMNINYIFLKSQNEYLPNDTPTLYIVSDGKLADFLRQKGEAVCISISSEDDLSSFEGYNYFITDGVPDFGHLEKIYCHLRNLPYVIGSSDRIVVREEKFEDLSTIYEMYNDSDCKKYLEALPAIDSFDKKERFETVKNGYMLYEYGMWIIEKKDSGEVIGRVGFEYLDEERVSVGYVIKFSERNKGFATEALKLAIGYLNDVCPKIKTVARCNRDNVFSVKTAKKLNLDIEIF